jgi:hypothetical protein
MTWCFGIMAYPVRMVLSALSNDAKPTSTSNSSPLTALVMELARAFSDPDVVTERSIRFVLWNNEESGHVLFGQRFSARAECRADDARRGRTARRGKPQEVRSL